jgi:hypothetical protein
MRSDDRDDQQEAPRGRGSDWERDGSGGQAIGSAGIPLQSGG